jgi:DNA (cytosine-5)-methyltransferase 1
MLRTLDLFSGIGGFSLGLERTGGFRTVAFCEIEPFCRRVLAKHWPEVPCYHDVRELTAERLAADGIAVDAVCGGPPCQRTSVAAAIQGKRTGETLWPEMARVIGAARPEWSIIEQPAGNPAWERQVADDLAGLGYNHARLERSASGSGAPHQRRRVFIVAHALRERCEAVARIAGSPSAEPQSWPPPPRGAWRQARAGDRRVDDGLSGWVDRLRALGNAVLPQVSELIGTAILQHIRREAA